MDNGMDQRPRPDVHSLLLGSKSRQLLSLQAGLTLTSGSASQPLEAIHCHTVLHCSLFIDSILDTLRPCFIVVRRRRALQKSLPARLLGLATLQLPQSKVHSQEHPLLIPIHPPQRAAGNPQIICRRFSDGASCLGSYF